jgi:type II secretory pathway pseudopilin PulG
MTGNYKPLRIERNSIKGFSTIELAFVMLLILVISSMAIPQAMRYPYDLVKRSS